MEDEHLEVVGVFTDGVSPLVNVPNALDDIIHTVGDKELVFEGLEEIVESRRRVDVRIVVAVPRFHVFVKKSGGDTGLLVDGKFGKVNVFNPEVSGLGLGDLRGGDGAFAHQCVDDSFPCGISFVAGLVDLFARQERHVDERIDQKIIFSGHNTPVRSWV